MQVGNFHLLSRRKKNEEEKKIRDLKEGRSCRCKNLSLKGGGGCFSPHAGGDRHGSNDFFRRAFGREKKKKKKNGILSGEIRQKEKRSA